MMSRLLSGKKLLVVMVFAALFGSMASFSLVSAESGWCGHDDVNGGSYTSALCVSQVYDSLPAATKSTMTKDQFITKSQGCMSGNSGGGLFGFDYNIHEGDCVNAVKTCLTQALDTSKCTNNNMKTIADSCNSGKLKSNGIGTLGCARLSSINNDTVKDYKDQITAQASQGANCTVKAANPQQPTESEKTQSQSDCKDAFNKAMSSCKFNETLQGENEAGPYKDYQDCLQNALKTSAADQSSCTARGGLWVDKANEGNGLTQGCKNQYSDLVNPQACAATGTGVWAQQKGTNSWGCHNPNDVCNKPDQWTVNDTSHCTQEILDKTKEDTKDPNKTADGPGNKLQGATNQCGKSETNIIGCSGTGGQAIGDVLKIFVMVLSFGVGIAAVGGLAYSAIQYAGASDNESHVSAAKERIRNIIIGLLLYGFLLVIVNWLLPGGIFS